MYTPDQPQTERIHRVVEDLIRSMCDNSPRLMKSSMLLVLESNETNPNKPPTAYTPFYSTYRAFILHFYTVVLGLAGGNCRLTC